MISHIFLLQTTKQNLLLGFMPESLGVLIFGVVLVVLAVGMRRILKYIEKDTNHEISGQKHKTSV
jgi:hypothetical protein